MIDRSSAFPSDYEPEAGRDVQLDKAGITVLTGFLGSGKTTLINHILTADHGRRIAVIENEFGETAIDGDLIVSSDEEIIEMANGCICCTLSVRNDLTSTLDKLLNRPNPPNHILVETSGLADPVPVAQAFFVDEVADRVAMDAIVTLVDAKHIDRHLDEIRPDSIEGQAVNQLVVADRIVLNKIDLVDAATAAKTEERIRSINNTAAVLHSSYAAVALDEIFGIGAFDHTGEAGFGEDFLEAPYPHAHDPEMQSHSFEIEGDLDREAVERWIAQLIVDKPRTDAMYRLKGILSVAGEHNTLVIQGVHALIELYRGGSTRGARRSRLVAIGKGIDSQLMQAELEACRVP